MAMDTKHNVDRLSEIPPNAGPLDVTIFDTGFRLWSVSSHTWHSSTLPHDLGVVHSLLQIIIATPQVMQKVTDHPAGGG